MGTKGPQRCASRCREYRLEGPDPGHLRGDPALPVVAVDVDECTELNRRYEVCSVPTVLLLRDGLPVNRLQDTHLLPVKAWLDAAR